MLLWQGNSTYDTEADKRRLRNIRHDNNIEQIRKNGFMGYCYTEPATGSFLRTHGDIEKAVNQN